MKTKIETLAYFLNCDKHELNQSVKNPCFFEHGRHEFLVLTDEEANKKATEEIKESVWAFNPNFLAEYTKLPIQLFDALIKADLCEGANDAILTLIEKFGSIEDFAEDALNQDGRGHFISPYDGEENELNHFYIYQIN